MALTLLVGGFAACERGTIDPTTPTDAELGRDFLPLEVHRYWVYDVKETHWNFNEDSVAQYQMRELIDTLFEGADGEPTFRVVRSRRADSTDSWRDDTAFALVRTPQLVRRTFANIPTVELMFPVREGKSWNPNLFNSLDSTERRYRDLDQLLALPNGKQFSQTVQVLDQGEDNIIKRREAFSVYARGVGRVSRTTRSLKYCELSDSLTNPCPPGTDYIVRGMEREEYLAEYGIRP